METKYWMEELGVYFKDNQRGTKYWVKELSPDFKGN